jgi:hypothetical protein
MLVEKDSRPQYIVSGKPGSGGVLLSVSDLLDVSKYSSCHIVE